MTTTVEGGANTLARCIQQVQEALSREGIDLSGRIVTSRDQDVSVLRRALAVDHAPGGFRKYQLPVYLPEASALFVTIAEPDAQTDRHSHDEGDGIRFVAGGSINYEGVELSAGDWMFIPRGLPYSFRAGPQGALLCYCYCCCC